MHPEGNVPRMQVNFNSPEQRGHRNAVVSPNFQTKPEGLGFSSKDVPYWHVNVDAFTDASHLPAPDVWYIHLYLRERYPANRMRSSLSSRASR